MSSNTQEPEQEIAPSLWDQTVELGVLLQQISDKDPEGHPSEIAAIAFRNWLAEAEPNSEDPRYFKDVAENYDIYGRSNKDLFDIFELLHPYVNIVAPEEPEVEAPPKRTFINLPLSG